MPPTPFHPTHQTPFKSTVSTSQQSRVHHTPFGGASSLSISVADIDPSEWRYHAEGGKNVLLSFAPASRSDGSPFATSMCTFALRIPKHLPGQEEEDEEEAEEFATGVITPLLGNPSVLPRCIRIPISTPRDRDIIETLAARIEMHRPATRRSHSARIRSERLTCIYAVEDVTAPLLVGGSSPVLCVEIKPKWGFLPRIKNLPPGSPNVEIKGRFSRYRMHRVTRAAAEGGRMTKEQFEALYDPLDLYSRDAGRKGRAVKALYRDWRETNGQTNNLRLFWNGELVKPDDSTTLSAVAEFLGVNAENLVEGLTQHIVQELSRPLPASLEGQDVLSKLSHLQSALDPLDVEGLAHLWLARTQSHTLGESPSDLPPSLTTPLPASQLLPVLQNFLTNKEVGLEEALQAFLVSATFKDCSLLFRFEGGGEAKVEGATKLVDLDRKAWNKLGKMQETDAEVCAAFLGWLESVGGEVA